MKDFIARLRIWMLRRREAHACSRAESAEQLRRYHAEIACEYEDASAAWQRLAQRDSGRIIDIMSAQLACAITDKRRHDAQREARKAAARTMRAVGVR